ncbi:hypothetical protein F4803DRAFT_166543 [Xylaria telfairii]|nr:hypothetical protein F4803DRAFT_166543 [Xylaria telfairii]
MGQSPSKPTPKVVVEQLTPTTPEISRQSASVLRPLNDSPVSPTSHSSQRSPIPLHTTRSYSQELEGTPRTRRDSDTVVFTDEGSIAVGSVGLQAFNGHYWHRKSQSSPVDRTQPQRPEHESYTHYVANTPVFETQLIHKKASLRIICPLLRGVLEQASMNPLSALQVNNAFSPVSNITEPYELLFHNRKRISQTAKEDAGEHTVLHVEQLLEFVKKERPSTWEKLEELEAGICRKIAFEDIWLIYPSGATVFAKDQGGWRAYKVERIESGSSWRPEEVQIHCLYLDLDMTGKCLTPKREVLTVRGYSSELPIGDLEVVPDWHFKNQEDFQEDLLEEFLKNLMERGKKFWEYTRNVNHKEYHGQAWPRSSRQGPIKIVIDYVTSSKHENFVQNMPGRIGGSATCLACLGEALGLSSYLTKAPHDSDVCRAPRNIVNKGSEDPSESVYNSFLFCPSRMWAFSLKHKSWELILPDDIGEVQRQDNALDQLVMKADDKKYVESALHAYQKDEWGKIGDGMVRGNRGGLTILLHGNPGTGKTFTAECLAAKYGIPLYKIICADLGTDLEVLEKRLQEICLRAANWKALLLLDEAEMFIQARHTQDLRQYAVVSTFLNHLDSSEALLFITSTRVDRLDQALESRVTLPIQLPDLSFEAQQRIWMSLIRRLENPSEDQERIWEQFIELDLSAAEDGAYITMNGRQIKTCITAALTVAHKENKSLNTTHIRKILRLGRDFRKLVQGNSDDPRDRHEYLRRQVQQLAA